MRFLELRLACLAAIAFPWLVTAQDQSPPFSQQLLNGLQNFPASDPPVARLLTLVRENEEELNSSVQQIQARRDRDHSGSRIACRWLSLILPDHYVDASSNQTSYQTLRTKNWSDNCDLPASCFLTPNAPVQVAVALQIINRSQSKFAVRSGGHNPNPGWAGVDQQGVTIDTGAFTELSLDAEKKIATVGAGLRFGPVQRFLDSQGVAVVSGRNNDVGVSGLLLGGGHPIINSLTGLAADQIHSAQIVTSDFRVLTASREENSDLFRAIKGGGNNFGIVTKWQLKTAMPRNIWYRIAQYPSTNAQGILEAFAQVQRNMESDPKAGIAITASPVGFVVAFVYGEYVENPAVFAPFTPFTPAAQPSPPTNGTVVGFINLNSPPQPPASRDSFGVTLVPDGKLYLESYNQYLAAAAANNGPNAALLMMIQTFGSSAVSIAGQNGGNVMGTSARAQAWWNPIAQWTNPADESRIHAALSSLTAQITENAKGKGLLDPYIFSNIGSKDQDVLASYGQANVRSIREVSRKYDPRQTFQRLQNGGFLWTRSKGRR